MSEIVLVHFVVQIFISSEKFDDVTRISTDWINACLICFIYTMCVGPRTSWRCHCRPLLNGTLRLRGLRPARCRRYIKTWAWCWLARFTAEVDVGVDDGLASQQQQQQQQQHDPTACLAEFSPCGGSCIVVAAIVIVSAMSTAFGAFRWLVFSSAAFPLAPWRGRSNLISPKSRTKHAHIARQLVDHHWPVRRCHIFLQISQFGEENCVIHFLSAYMSMKR